MSLLDVASTLFGAAKTPEALRAEIEEEIRFHLDARARELEAAGASPDEARARAQELFGAVDRTALECLTIQMGARVMLQRIQWVIIAVLVACLGGLWLKHVVALRESRAMMAELRAEREELAERARESEARAADRRRSDGVAPISAGERLLAEAQPLSPEAVTAAWLARFREHPDDWRHGLATADALVDELSPEEAVRVLSELWAELSDAHKQQALKAVAFRHGHPGTLAVMNLGATDASLEVQNRALGYLRDYAFRSFEDDYEAYLAWYAEWKDRPLDEVLLGNARAFVQGLFGRSPEGLEELLRDFRDLDLRAGESLGVDLAAVLRDAGALVLVEDWLASADEQARRRAFSWAATLEPGEAWLRDHLLPFVEDAVAGDDPLAGSAMRALGSPANAWAAPAVVGFMERTVPLTLDDTPHAAIWSASGALAGMGDPAVIPSMIGLIASNPCYDTIYGIGYFGLGKLTGVSYDDSHDGAWWTAWWQANLGRFPPEVRALPIPDYPSDR